MSNDLYRDANVGLRARLAELSTRIVDREEEVTDDFWVTVPVTLRERLDELREGLELVGSEDFEELARAESLLAAYLTELDALLEGIPLLEADWSAVPDDVPSVPVSERPWRIGYLREDAAHVIARDCKAMVRELDRAATFETDGPLAWVAHFEYLECPFVLQASVLSVANEEVGEVAMCLVTGIPRGLPALVVRHETLVLTIGKAIGLKHEVDVGEASFDGLFLIEGTQEAADLFLPPNVRNQLLTLARFDVPTLTVDPLERRAMLRWRFEPAARALDAAVRVLSFVRKAPPSLKFRRNG